MISRLDWNRLAIIAAIGLFVSIAVFSAVVIGMQASGAAMVIRILLVLVLVALISSANSLPSLIMRWLVVAMVKSTDNETGEYLQYSPSGHEILQGQALITLLYAVCILLSSGDISWIWCLMFSMLPLSHWSLRGAPHETINVRKIALNTMGVIIIVLLFCPPVWKFASIVSLAVCRAGASLFCY